MAKNPWTEYCAAKTQPEKEAILKKMYPGITSKELEIFKRKLSVPEYEEGHPTWDDFYAAEGRQEKEAILQKMFKGTLTPEEIELFFPKDGKNEKLKSLC